VVQPDDSTALIGLLSRRELTSANTSLIQSLRSPATSGSGKVRGPVRPARPPQNGFVLTLLPTLLLFLPSHRDVTGY
jgi:hypothetical protein